MHNFFARKLNNVVIFRYFAFTQMKNLFVLLLWQHSEFVHHMAYIVLTLLMSYDNMTIFLF